MKRQFVICSVLFAAACSYEPAFDLTCPNEGARDGNRRCEGGVWLVEDAGPPLADAGIPDDTGTGGNNTPGDDVGDIPDVRTCEPESDAEFCARFGFTCDDVTEVDTCGNSRTVNCGVCSGNATCGGGGTPNVCACPGQSDVDFCAANGKVCDPFTAADECGEMRTVNCGTCLGLLTCSSDNTCECEPAAACAALGANCGNVSVNGQCGNTTTVDCGSCGADATCGGDNTCACDAGFAGDGFNCADIDECAGQTDDCDPNATCTNTPGAFTCRCNQGYVGNGKTCVLDAVPLVVSSQAIPLFFQDGDTTKKSTINTVDADQTVLFVTRRFSQSGDEIDRLGIDVFLSADDELTVSRDDGTEASAVQVYAVEFDPAVATVQRGTFSAGGTSDTVDLSTAVDPAKSFVVFYSYATDNTDRRQSLFVSATLNAQGTQLQFTRDSNAGNMTGHWWVVESVDTAFSVQHASSTLSTSDTRADVAITNVATDKSLLLYSFTSDLAANDNDATNVTCSLQSSTNVRCDRYIDIGAIPDLDVQVVSFTATPTIYRGIQAFPADTETRTATIGATVGADAIAFGGALGTAGVEMSDTLVGDEGPGGFFTQRLVGGNTQVEMRRGAPRDSAAEVSWQVIDW